MLTKTLENPNQLNTDEKDDVVVTLIEGDGIGPEIIGQTIRILDYAKSGIQFEKIEAGSSVYLSGILSGIGENAWDTIRQYPTILKGPITTPRGKGYKSLNVTIRKTLGLYANVRPAKTYDPFIKTNHSGTDIVIIRENEEDTYAGIEHRQTREVTQCLKLITVPGTEKIVRYAFEFARSNGRKKITCMVKDNIMKITDGMFANIFLTIAKEYPEIEAESMIIDIGAALLANRPQKFDVILAPNLYGDILSDIAAEVTGSVGMCGSANIGDMVSMFEAVHGSAPDIAGKNIANPTAVIKATVMMLTHLGKPGKAKLIRNAVLKTLEDGYRTTDIYQNEKNTILVGTKEYADAIIDRLGKDPNVLTASELVKPKSFQLSLSNQKEKKELVGVDVFLDIPNNRNPDVLGKNIESIAEQFLHLKMITNRGVKVYPKGQKETFLTDHFRCRFVSPTGGKIQHKDITAVLTILEAKGYDFIKTENLYEFDGVPGYSLGQGE
ncbi:isocitrate dehydrogenase [Leptospira yanagawae serovar Saopaulo str. Sao Paulo = ATCC 700523]|uniref:Isocitrate dehydrogenase [NADP] n=1 Tax=Leptospira yanagawae serovar Saopaulo str. Sao Paulo = ATCC 700523 TaxID=1249483 RepID=A0A5E8HBH6_9LEPT|nr:NADP-dependent isocitrate dehydrogenase [Leptospira yanagawae]EOQ88554.1 isocitrate dehydrogenase [Leptospira yanagawae serovar Saopaulo str. Sao Paulo = ATCC 700523]